MAAAAALFKRQLDDIDGTNVDTNRGLAETAQSVNTLGTSTKRSAADIDQFSGRLRLLADVAVTLGPALVPIGAVAVPAITGLASAFGFAAAGGASAIVAFQGVGDALDTMRKAQLEPTTANIQAAHAAMEQIGGPARDFVRELITMGPALREVRDSAAAGLFPGMVEALDSFEGALPRVTSLFGTLGEAMGDLASDAAESITGPKWAEFFRFIEAEAPGALSTLGSAVGSVAHGFAELWMAFQPLNNDFAGWLQDAAKGFDEWASGLDQTEGFQEFIDYIRESGPQVAAAGKAIGNALVQIVDAAAPLGGPVLSIITKFANALATLADSPIGTPLLATVAALTALNRAAVLLGASGAAGMAGFSSKLSALALRGPIAAAGILTIFDALDTVDSISRSNEVLDETSRSIGDLATTLQGSNVGKYAQDLGIDVQKLAEDLYKNGSAGEYASEVFDKLAASSGGTGNALEFLGGTILPGLTTESQKAFDAFNDLEAISGRIRPGGGLKDLLGAFSDGTSAANEFKEALLDVNDVLAGRANMRAYQEAIDAATQSLKDNGKTLDDNTEKGRANNAALDAIASSALQVAETLRAGPQRKTFLAGARQEFLQAAESMGMGERAARSLARQLGLLGGMKAKPKVELDDGRFKNASAEVQRRVKALNFLTANPKADLNNLAFIKAFGLTKADINWLDKARANPTAALKDLASGPINSISGKLSALNGKTATTYIKTVMQTVRQNLPHIATGGYVTGPGTGTSDDIPAYLSNGEYVIKAAAVEKYGVDTLHRMNAMMLANGGLVSHTYAKGYANGGEVESITGDPFGSVIGPMSTVTRAWAAEVRASLRDAEKRREAVEKEVDAAKEFRDSLRDAARSLSEGIAQQFSGSDLFGVEGATFESIVTGLKEQAQEASNFAQLTLRLKRQGLDGGALQALLETGNLALLTEFAGKSAAELALFEAQFNATQAKAQDAGQAAAFARFGEEQAAANAHLRAVNEKLERAERREKVLERRMERMEKLQERETKATESMAGQTRSAARRNAGKN
jgi:hypothetical protein